MPTTFSVTPERKEEILRIVRRAALIVIPAIGLFVFAGLLAWTVRRQLDSLTEGLAVDEPTDQSTFESTEEPTYEMSEDVAPV